MKKILFVILDNLDSGKSHITRLNLEMELISKNIDINVIILNKDNGYKPINNVTFFHYPIKFIGWDLQDISILSDYLNKKIDEIKPELVILCIEIWDLIKVLYNLTKIKNIPFAVMLHAMPFLCAPLHCSNNFSDDVNKYLLNKNLLDYKKEYIKKHFIELQKTLNSGKFF